MKALKDHAEFISDNVYKLHKAIKNGDDNDIATHVQSFVNELYEKAAETIDVDLQTIDGTALGGVVALFMQASELWQMFCKEYYITYPKDPKYFDGSLTLKVFESLVRKGVIK